MFNPYFQNNMQPQQVTQVNGKASVDQIKLAPNSSILLMDTTAPMVWLCVSDGVGVVKSTAYDITPHIEKPPVDTQALETRLSAIEATLAEMEKRNAKSDDAIPKPKGEQSVRNNK